MEAARPATANDLPRLADLCRMARDELAPMRGGQLLLARAEREPLEASLVAVLEDPDRGVWAGTIDGTIVGYSIGHVEQLGRLDDGLPGRLGVIDDLFVEPDARSVGVGEAMMETMLGWFTAGGCRGVDALALPGHRSAKNFFEGSGFTARLLIMHRRLDG
jgi:GNAT superfamily N-acetyltransferase